MRKTQPGPYGMRMRSSTDTDGETGVLCDKKASNLVRERFRRCNINLRTRSCIATATGKQHNVGLSGLQGRSMFKSGGSSPSIVQCERASTQRTHRATGFPQPDPLVAFTQLLTCTALGKIPRAAKIRIAHKRTGSRSGSARSSSTTAATGRSTTESAPS